MDENKTLEAMAHDFDPEFLRQKKEQMGGILNTFIDLDSSIVKGTKQIKSIQDSDPNSVFIYASNHKSHVDYLFIGYKFFDAHLKPMRYAAGANMFLGPLNRYWRKLGAFSIDRQKSKQSDYLHMLYDYVEKLVETKNDILLFPEGGRSYHGGFNKIKSGILGAAVEAQKKNISLNVYVVPVTVAYDRVVEDKAYPYLKEISDMKPSMLKKMRYYNQDITRFITKSLFEPEGKGYLNVGNPFLVKDMLSKEKNTKAVRKEICDILADSYEKDFPITQTALVSKILEAKPEILISDLSKEVDAKRDEFKQAGWNDSFLPESSAVIVANTLTLFCDGRLGYLERDNQLVVVRNPEIIRYYSNMLSFTSKAK